MSLTIPSPLISSLHFAPASADDFDDLLALRIEAMRDSLERIERFDPERARLRFLAGFAPDATRYIVQNGERIGFIVVKSDAADLLLDHLYIRPAAQGKGIGTLVLQQLFAQADAEGRVVRVGALRESASNRFYQRHGFALVSSGEFDRYYVRAARRPHQD
ncbi:MAG: GNAT family N-acetyltransferase [Burkholderiales bacterium]|nr:GNAT family N-acetyltransferase [Burkholderiales bacterium]